MRKELLEELLQHITVQLNKTMNILNFFHCWENSDRRWEYDDEKIEYILSTDVDELTYVYMHFLYDPKSDVLQLIRSGFNVDDCIMWEKRNASELTKDSDYSDLLDIFHSQMSLWYDCLINIKKIDEKAKEDKKFWNKTMHNIARDIFKYDVE